MSDRPTDGLIRELVRDLRPVRPLPRLRVVGAAVLGAWGLALGLDWLFADWLPRAGTGSFWAEPAFVAVFGGLLLTAGAALVAALAAAVPGREGLARIGRNAAFVGVAVALGAGLLALATAATGSGTPLSRHLACTGHACALGIVPAAVACVFLARASTRRPLLAVGAAAVGAAMLGAVAVHASCSAGGAHWLLGHSLGPLTAALVLAFPLAALVARGSRRSRPLS